MYGMKPSKKLPPMKPVSGSGLGRQRYSTPLQKRPKTMGAEPIRPAALKMKTSKASSKIFMPRQETKSIGS